MAKIHQLDELLAQKSAKAKGKPTSGFSPVATVEPSITNGDELKWVDVDLIDDNPHQPRLSYANDKQLELVGDLNRDGQLQPGLARPHPTKKGRYLLAAAHRRKYAIKEGAYFKNPDTGEETKVYANAGSRQPNPDQFAGKMLLVVRPDISPLELRRYAYKENASRVNLAPMELEKFYNDTREALTEELRRDGTIGPTAEAPWRAVGDFLGENFRTIHRIARLKELPPAMKKALESGQLNERHGRALMELSEWEKEQRNLFGDIKKHGWSGSHSEKVAAERKKLLNDKVPTPDSLIDEAVEEELDKREQSPQAKAEEAKSEEQAQISRRGLTLVGNTITEATPANSTDVAASTQALQQKLQSVAAPPPADTAQRKARATGALETALSNLMFAKECLVVLDDKAKAEVRQQVQIALDLIDENSDVIRESLDCWPA